MTKIRRLKASEDWVSVAAFCQRVDISIPTAYRWTYAGILAKPTKPPSGTGPTGWSEAYVHGWFQEHPDVEDLKRLDPGNWLSVDGLAERCNVDTNAVLRWCEFGSLAPPRKRESLPPGWTVKAIEKWEASKDRDTALEEYTSTCRLALEAYVRAADGWGEGEAVMVEVPRTLIRTTARVGGCPSGWTGAVAVDVAEVLVAAKKARLLLAKGYTLSGTTSKLIISKDSK